jgi:Bacterial toxin 43
LYNPLEIKEFVMKIILLNSTSCIDETQESIELISAMLFPEPLDFIFDCNRDILAIATDFEGHPELVEHLKIIPTDSQFQIVGGRFGRTKSGELATSEWSGHYGHGWNELTRNYFQNFMQKCNIPVIHREWHSQQTAYEVG